LIGDRLIVGQLLSKIADDIAHAERAVRRSLDARKHDGELMWVTWPVAPGPSSLPV
jgi:hypothetical protein